MFPILRKVREGSECSVKSYTNSHDGRMFFFLIELMYAARDLNAPNPAFQLQGDGHSRNGIFFKLPIKDNTKLS